MKTVLTLFLASAVSLPTALASVGLHGGLNISNVSSDLSPSSSTDSATGFILGVHYEQNLLPSVSIEPGFQVAQRGYGLTVGTTSGKFLISYLEVPILLKAKLLNAAGIAPFLIAGPNFGIKVGSSCSVSGDGDCIVDDEAIESTTLGLEAGIGADLSLPATGVLSLSLRYYFGLSDYAKTPARALKHEGVEILAGFKF